MCELVKHCPSWDSYISKNELSIVYSVNSDFMSHIFNVYSWTWRHLFHFSNLVHAFVSDLNDEGVDSLVFPIYDSLCEYNSVVCVTSPISNPIFMRKSRRTINNKFLFFFIIGDFFHLLVKKLLNETFIIKSNFVDSNLP